MLNENIKRLRKQKRMTQEEAAEHLNVVRQTISKWEKGLSVPDSEMLIRIADMFEVSVSSLLGENIEITENDDEMKIISEKLERMNKDMADRNKRRRRSILGLSIAGIIIVAIMLFYHVVSVSTFQNHSGGEIIGGADGPTSIYLASPGLGAAGFIILIVILIVSICGIVISRKR